ncbi:uncharacterized protein CBL_00067 [Carabus blaptoides fortunei]
MSGNVDFIPDLPIGPLDEYRKMATFNWKKMNIVLEKPQKLKLKLEIWNTLEKDPLFQHPSTTVSTEELKRLSAVRVKKFLKYNFLQRNTEKMTYSTKTKQLMTANEALVVLFPDVSIKLGLGYSLFTNALLSMGTERHKEIYKVAWAGQIFAGFALTEISHGSNTKNMQTTATYDPCTQEYIINTPNFESAKCYVGNLGKTCNMVLLFAQLHVEGECKGLHQLRLFPYVAASYVFKLFIETCTDLYVTTVEKSNSGAKIDNLTEFVSELHAMISSAKPLITWTCRDAIQECREACGGFGYLKSARLCDMRGDQDPAVTYEGDNNVLVQQTSKWLLRQWTNRHEPDENVSSPIGTCTYFKLGEQILQRRFSGTSVEDFNNIHCIFQAYEWLVCWLCSITGNGSADNQAKVYWTRVLPIAYGQHMVLTFYWREIQKYAYDTSLQTVLQQLARLYGLWCIEKHLVYFYEGGYATGPNFAKYVKESILTLCSDIKPNAVAAVDALAPTDYVLNSVLGKSDGQLYLNLQSEFLHSEGNMSRPTWWKEFADPYAPDIRKLIAKL